MITLASSETLSALADGAVLTRNADLALHLDAQAQVTFDLQWLRSLAGRLQGSTGIRIDAESAATITLAVSCRCLATVHRHDREGQPWLHLTLEKEQARSSPPSLAVQASLPVPPHVDPLRLALTGEHPRQHFRHLLKDPAGAAYCALLQNSGIPSRQLAALAALWPSLTTSTEPVLWTAAEDPTLLSAIRDATRWLATECPSAAYLQQNSPLPPLLQWFDALTSSPATAQLPPSAFRQATESARACLPLLQLPELPNLLRQIRHALPATPLVASQPSLHLARRLYQAAGRALAQGLSTDLSTRLSAHSTPTPLLNASFPMDAPGLELCRQALTGNLTPLFAATSPAVKIHDALLTKSLFRQRTLEIHLPFLFSTAREEKLGSKTPTDIITVNNCRLTFVRSATAQKTNLSTLHTEQQSSMIIAAALSAGDGEPVNDNFSLAFSDVRDILPGRDNQGYLRMIAAYGIQNVTLPAGPARATLSITLSGSVVQAWAQIPLSRSVALNPILCRVSLALQTALRRWLPMLYFANPDRYATPSAAFPLLAYQCSLPHARVGLGQYAYDSMDPSAVLSALKSAVPRLSGALAGIRDTLTAAGNPDLAAKYDPENLPAILQSVISKKRLFTALLAADSFFIEQVFSLARHSRDLATTAANDPRRAARQLHVFTGEFVEVFHRRLTRLYGGQDFTSLGSLLLIEATAALADRRDSLQASFTIEPIALNATNPAGYGISSVGCPSVNRSVFMLPSD